jgi:YVTN family beta-propeller protein
MRRSFLFSIAIFFLGLFLLSSASTTVFSFSATSSGNVSNVPTLGHVIKQVKVGYDPRYVIYDPANHYMYVVSVASSTVSVINSSTNKVIKTINVTGADSLAYASNSNEIFAPYIVKNGVGGVWVINGTTNTVIKNIKFAETDKIVGPAGAGYDSTNGYVYVSVSRCCESYGGYEFYIRGNVTVINALTNTIVTSMRVYDYPVGVTFDPENNEIYVANTCASGVTGHMIDEPNGCWVTVINGTSNAVVKELKFSSFGDGVSPYNDVYDPSNGEIYVQNGSCGNASHHNRACWVGVVNATTNDLTKEIILAHYPIIINMLGIAYVPLSDQLWVSGYQNVSVISGKNNRDVGWIKIPGIGAGLAYDPANSYVYVTEEGPSSDLVAVICTKC